MVKPGDVALYTGTDIYSKGIQFATRSKWSHAGLVVAVNQSGPTVVEATQQGLKLTRIGGVPGWQCRDSGLTDAERAEVTKWALTKYAKGCRYDYGDIFWIAVHILFPFLPITMEGTGRYFCSSFVSWALIHGGADIDAPEFVAPADLDRLYPLPA